MSDPVIQSFFNIGGRAGASIPHLHGQTIIFLNKKITGFKERYYLKASERSDGRCIKCQYWEKEHLSSNSSTFKINDRILLRNDHWMAFLAYAPEREGHIRLLPKRHVDSLWSTDQDELDSLAEIIIKSNQLLTSFVKTEGNIFQLATDRNIIIRQILKSSKTDFHFFIDILPVQQIGGAELFDSQKFSSDLPENITKRILDLNPSINAEL
jgi:galactose-1-phosphate uridylyltransferase